MNEIRTLLVDSSTLLKVKTASFVQIYFFTMKNIYLFIVSLFFFYTGCDTQQTKYPFSVETVLAKAGNNRKELEKALDYFYKQGDSIKIKAIEFLVAAYGYPLQ